MKERNKFINKVTKEYSKALEKTARSHSQSMFREVNLFQGGGVGEILHIFQTPNGIMIHVNTEVIHFSGGGLGSSVKFEPMKCCCGVMIDGPVPGSYCLIEVRDGMSRRLNWLPYRLGMDAQDVFKDRAGWDVFVSSVNSDSRCVEDLRKLPRSRTINGIDSNFQVGRFSKLEVKIEDKEVGGATLGQIVPMGLGTFVGICFVVRDLKDIRYAVNSMLRIVGHIQSFRFGQFVEEPVVDGWANKLLNQMGLGTSQMDGLAGKVVPPPVVEEVQSVEDEEKSCSSCGHLNPADFRFCINCGTEFIQPDNRCPVCGHVNDPKFRFCVSCGRELLEEHSKPVAKIVETPTAPVPEPEVVEPLPVAEQEPIVKELKAPAAPEPFTPPTPKPPESIKQPKIVPESHFAEMEKDIVDVSYDLTAKYAEEEAMVAEEIEPFFEDEISAVAEEADEGSVLRVRFATRSGRVRELHLRDILGEGWVSEGRVLDLLWDQVDAVSHYDWFKAVKEVEGAENGMMWMHLSIKFSSEADDPFTDTLYHILLAVNQEDNGFTGAGINITASEDTYFDCLNIVINKPEQIKQLTLWVPLDYTKK
jgi:hypothetical protein